MSILTRLYSVSLQSCLRPVSSPPPAPEGWDKDTTNYITLFTNLVTIPPGSSALLSVVLSLLYSRVALLLISTVVLLFTPEQC